MSKFKSINVFLLAVILLAVSHEVTLAQGKSLKTKVKSIIVTEEKHDGPTIKTNKESEIHYDLNGNIIEDIEYKDGSFVSHFVYEYDPDDNKIKETEFDKNGKVAKVSLYKYENGLRVEKSVFDDKGNLKTKKTYKYTTF
jgi:hypothetical protein